MTYIFHDGLWKRFEIRNSYHNGAEELERLAARAFRAGFNRFYSRRVVKLLNKVDLIVLVALLKDGATLRTFTQFYLTTFFKSLGSSLHSSSSID